MIQIIDGFKLNSTVPIDSRFAVADATERLAITYLYHGLRVWQLDTNIPWFWDGTTWVSELDNVVTATGSIPVDNIPKIYNNSPYRIGQSQIDDDGTTVSIINDLTVGNDITFTGSLNGNLDASNIISGTLSLSHLQGGSNGDVLMMTSSTPTWTPQAALTIGSATQADKVVVDQTTIGPKYKLLMKDISAVNGIAPFKPFSNNSSGLVLEETSNGLVMLAIDGANTRPSYSFASTDNSGIYYSGGVNVSVGGSDKLKIEPSYVNFGIGSIGDPRIKIGIDSVTTPSYTWWGNDQTGIYRPANDQVGFTIGGVRKLGIDSVSATFGDNNVGDPRIRVGTGTNNNPSYSWWGNDTTGMYRSASNTIAFSINTVDKFYINTDGTLFTGRNWMTAQNANGNYEYALKVKNLDTSNPLSGGVYIETENNSTGSLLEAINTNFNKGFKVDNNGDVNVFGGANFTVTGGIDVNLGSISTPSISCFEPAPVVFGGPLDLSDTGIYFSGVDDGGPAGTFKQMNFSSYGFNKVTLWGNSNSSNIGGLIITPIGTSAQPGISFGDSVYNERGTGIYSNVGFQELNFANSGSLRMRFSGSSAIPTEQRTIDMYGRMLLQSRNGNIITDNGTTSTYALRINQTNASGFGLFVNTSSNTGNVFVAYASGNKGIAVDNSGSVSFPNSTNVVVSGTLTVNSNTILDNALTVDGNIFLRNNQWFIASTSTNTNDWKFYIHPTSGVLVRDIVVYDSGKMWGSTSTLYNPGSIPSGTTYLNHGSGQHASLSTIVISTSHDTLLTVYVQGGHADDLRIYLGGFGFVARSRSDGDDRQTSISYIIPAGSTYDVYCGGCSNLDVVFWTQKIGI